jgi:hypothetical protein
VRVGAGNPAKSYTCHDALKASDPKRASRFKTAMNVIFEHRVGSVLDRIAQHEARFGGVVVINEGACAKTGKHSPAIRGRGGHEPAAELGIARCASNPGRFTGTPSAELVV